VTLRRLILSALIVFLAASCVIAQSRQPQSQKREAEQPEVRTGIWRGMNVTYQWFPTKDGKGKALYQGDILLDHVEQSPNGAHGLSLGVTYASYLWPAVDGVVSIPYTIDPDSGDVTNLNTAISDFNTTFSGLIQLVAYTNQTDYIDFNFDSNNTSGACEAYEGRVGGEQVVGGSGTCTVATILHELGHTVGVWHEQSRPDRNTYVDVNYGAVIKASRSFFDVMPDNNQELTLYDYASVMEYPAFSFSRNGEPCVESIPAGMPLSNSAGYSAGDIDGIDRLYGAIPTQVTVTSNPPGLQVTVDGETITTPQVYSWALNSTHTLSVTSVPQTLSSTGISYIYGRWNDSTEPSHSITVAPGNNTVAQPASAPAVTVYSANFIQLVPYVNAISPSGSGTVSTSPNPQSYSGLSGVYYTIREPVTLTATPSSGENFLDYINSPNWLPGGLGANPKTFYVMDDGTSIDLTTYFTTSPVYTVTTNPVESNVGVTLDNADFWYAPVNFSPDFNLGPTQWTPGSTHTLSIDSPQSPWSGNTYFAFSSWSDGGAQTHTITLPESGSASYTASIQGNYYVDDYVNESCAGSISVTPASTENGYYPSGSVLTFSETPNAGWDFTEWLYDLSGESGSSENLTVSDEVLVVADYDTTTTPLQLTSISPANAVAGGGPFTLTISGAGFTSSTVAYINGGYRFATYVSATQVTVAMTAADIAIPGAFQVAVGNFPSGASCAAFQPTTFYVLLNSAPTASVSPSSLSFGSVAAGTASASQAITLANNGGAALPITSINASGNFAETNNCSSSLAANSSCTVNVTFTPTVAGAVSGAVTFNDGAASTPQIVTLGGTGVTPLSLKPASLGFGSVAVGKTSAVKTVTVTNNESTAISLSTGASADFTISGGTCGSSLNAGAKCTISATYTPTSAGAVDGALTIATNGALSPQIVGLSGTGTGGPNVPLSFNPTTVSLAATGVGATSAAKTVTVTNTSSSSVNITSISASADFAAMGSGSSPCGGALGAGAKCTLGVTFSPTDVGATKGSIAVASSGSGSPQFVDVSGTGKLPIVLAPTSIAFGDVTVGTTSAAKTVTVTNDSGATVDISSIVASGDFTATSSGSKACGETLAAGAKCDFTVTFTPNVSGAISGAATVSTNAPLSPAVVQLTGTGQ
jgi:hypothetical protein